MTVESFFKVACFLGSLLYIFLTNIALSNAFFLNAPNDTHVPENNLSCFHDIMSC